MTDLFVWVILLATAVLEPEEGSSGVDRPTQADTVVLHEWKDLDSPWYAVRRRAERRLMHLERSDAMRVVQVLLTSDRAPYRHAAATWVLSRLERESEVEAEIDLLVRALLNERDPAVVERMVQAAALEQKCVDRLCYESASGRIGSQVIDRVLAARLVILFERVMHEGQVPGFFDGQFAELHSMDGTVFESLARISLDPRVHFVVRTLAIMSLHEGESDDLYAILRPLIVDPTREVLIQQSMKRSVDLTFMEIRDYIKTRLSQYARFSLAKAGIPGPIDEKIDRLWREAVRYERVADALRDSSEDARYLDYLEEAMDYYFELGYHHQQLDRFLEAELEYRKITGIEVVTRARRMAHYNMACIRALQGRTDEAIEEIRQAVRAGFKDVSWAMRDGDLKSLHDDPRFHRVLSELNAARNESAP